MRSDRLVAGCYQFSEDWNALMFERLTRFSILQLMAAMIVLAMFFVALFNNNEWWRATLGTITMGMILNSMLAAIFARGERRAVSLSYFLGAIFFLLGIYSYIASLPYLLTLRLFEFLEANSATPPDSENFYIVAGIFWLQFTCWLSALIGRRWYRRTLAESAVNCVIEIASDET